MKRLTCEMCGGTNLIKQDGVFVCQTCGAKYSVEEAKKLMNEGDSDINKKLDSVPREPFSITFDRVSFGYGDFQILRNVSFTIRPGEKVLIKGGNGQGKSTLLKLILGLYRPKEGRILFGETYLPDMLDLIEHLLIGLLDHIPLSFLSFSASS